MQLDKKIVFPRFSLVLPLCLLFWPRSPNEVAEIRLFCDESSVALHRHSHISRTPFERLRLTVAFLLHKICSLVFIVFSWWLPSLLFLPFPYTPDAAVSLICNGVPRCSGSRI